MLFCVLSLKEEWGSVEMWLTYSVFCILSFWPIRYNIFFSNSRHTPPQKSTDGQRNELSVCLNKLLSHRNSLDFRYSFHKSTTTETKDLLCLTVRAILFCNARFNPCTRRGARRCAGSTQHSLQHLYLILTWIDSFSQPHASISTGFQCVHL